MTDGAPPPPESLTQLLRERDQLLRQHEALADVARAVSGSLRLDDVTHLSMAHAVALLRVGGATFGLLRDSTIAVVAGTGDGEIIVGATLPLTGSLTGAALQEKRAIICNDLANEPRVYNPTRIAARVQKTIVAPLFGNGGTIGALAVINRDEDFTEADAVVLQQLADQVAIAVENARLYEEAQALAERYRHASDEERRARDAVAQSEARYRNLFDSATDAIYTLDGHGAFTSVNDATCQLSGRRRDELLGRSPFQMITEDEIPHVKEHVKSALAGSPRRYECHVERTDGTQRLLSVTNTPIRLGGRVIGVLGIARDVTDERERALALERSETRYSRLVEAASDAIFTVDAEGALTSINRSLERSTGRERSELLGTRFGLLIDERDRTQAEQVLRNTFAGQRTRAELRYLAATGDIRYCSLTLTPLHEAGEAIGALGIVRDVTDERRLTEQLIQQEKLAAVGQLVSGVAHELNNPLASVMAFAQLLLTSPLAQQPDERSAAEAINQEARRAAKIVSNLLTFARQHQPQRTITDLNRVVEDTIELRRYALRVAQVDLVLHLDSDLPLTWADPFQLQQVVLNLVTNAEQALASWEQPRSIVVATALVGEQLVIRVTDSGPGIAPENIHRVFNPFFTTKPVGEGTGLGLSISDGIVREHGGRIRAESGPQGGATFVVELPRVEPSTVEPAVSATRRAPNGPSRRILVVDDEPAIRTAIGAYFRSLGHTVQTVATGREAITLASDNNYDAVLLDLRLPDISGDLVFAELRRVPRLANRVIFMTGDTQSESARATLAATQRPTVSKPFLLDELAEVVLAQPSA